MRPLQALELDPFDKKRWEDAGVAEKDYMMHHYVLCQTKKINHRKYHAAIDVALQALEFMREQSEKDGNVDAVLEAEELWHESFGEIQSLDIIPQAQGTS
jgi:hypothetical protein